MLFCIQIASIKIVVEGEMRFRQWITLTLGCLLLMAGMIGQAAVGQARDLPRYAAQDDSQCTAVVQQALRAVGDNCEGLGRNAACYGYNSVGATFLQDVDENFFTLPADRAEIGIIESIRTTPLSLNDNQWGIAVMRVQANLPNTIPGQGVLFMLLGETSVTNAVAQDAAFVPVEPVMVTSTVNANVRSGPSTRNNVLFAVGVGTSLAADAQNPAGDWLRITYGDRVGWIFGELVTGADTSTLPVIDETSVGPMQAFYFTTGIGETLCAEAPDVLLIQGPENITVDLTANEANISISSTVLLQLIDENTMQITVVDGQAVVNNLVVPAGFKARAPIDLDPDNDATPEGTPEVSAITHPGIDGPWEGCQRIDEADRALINTLMNIPPELLHYPIEQPANTNAICAPPGTQPPSQTQQPQQPPPASTEETGQVTPQPPAEGVDCSAFAGTFPTGGSIPYGVSQFFWNAAPGAARYRVVINSDTGGVVGIIETGDPSTTVSVDSSGWSGNSFTWEVQALDAGGQTVCTAPRLTFTRDQAPPQTEDPYRGGSAPG